MAQGMERNNLARCVGSDGTVVGLAVDRPMSRQRQKCYHIGHMGVLDIATQEMFYPTTHTPSSP